MTEQIWTKLSFSFGLNIPMSPLKSDKASKLTQSSAALVQRKKSAWTTFRRIVGKLKPTGWPTFKASLTSAMLAWASSLDPDLLLNLKLWKANLFLKNVYRVDHKNHSQLKKGRLTKVESWVNTDWSNIYLCSSAALVQPPLKSETRRLQFY